MNRLKKRILSTITAVAVAFASLGALPDIPPLTSLVTPASAVNEYGPYDFYINSERVVLPEDIIEILEVAGCFVDNNDYGKDNHCRKIRIYVDSDGKNLLGIYDTYDNSVATITKSGTGWWFVKRDSNYKLFFNWRSITLPTLEHGSVSASISCEEVGSEQGENYFVNTVTLTVTPDEGYCLTSLTVTDASSNPIAVTNNTFVMPESDATVTAEFQDITTWSGLQAAFATGADIKLDRDYTAGENDTKLTVPYGKTVNLDLNGHTIDRGLSAANAKEDGCVICVNGTLNLKDTSTDHNGKITGGNSSDYGGGGVKVNGIFNMSGGTISGNHAKCGGGLSVTSGSTFNMTGGTISGNNSTDSGGGVYNDNTGVLNISGGTISGNTAGGYGGGIRFGGAFTMSGGTITGNTAAKGGSGVYAGYTNFSISGSPVVTGNTGDDVVLFAEKNKFEVTGALTENASIGVKLLDRENNVTDGVFAYAASDYNGGKLKDSDIAHFTSTESALTVSMNDNGEAELVPATVSPVSTSYVYKGNTTNVPEAIPLNCFMTDLSEGTYVVNSNVNFTKKITLRGNVTIILEDGKTMTVTTTGSDEDFAIYGENCTLNIYGQSAGTGKLDAKAAAASEAIHIEGNSSLGIHGGVVNADAIGNANASTGIVVRSYTTGNSIVIDGGKVTATGKIFGIVCAGGNFNITGGQVTAAGSNVGLAVCDYEGDHSTIPGILTLGCTNATDSITITGGIYNYSSVSGAGEVKIVDGITLTDDVTGYFSGTLSQNTINSFTGTKTLTLASSKVYNNITFYSWKGKTSLPTTAGNYYLAEDVTLSTTWTVPTGTVNLDLNGHSIRITGSGKVISVPQNATLNMYDSGTGEHKYEIFYDYAHVDDSLTEDYKTFTGGYITGGKNSGVNISAKGTFMLYGGTIIGNIAENIDGGGGVYVGGTFEMHGGSIIGNKASFGKGGGVYVHSSGIFTMSGGRIIDNYAGYSGGGVYFYTFDTFIVSGTPVIKNNTVNGTANNVYIPSGIMIKYSSLSTGAEIGVTMETAGYILSGSVTEAYTNYFTSDDGNYDVAFKDGDLKLVPHTHSFTYTASGDTLSATCTATNCALHTTPATLTIGKPEHATYGDGKAAAATITDVNSIQGEAAVVYYKAKSDGTKDGSALAEAPTDAGKYRAEITLGTGTGAKTAFVVYTIAKAAGPTDELTIECDHTDTTITVTAPAQTDTATYEYSINSIDWQTGTEFTKLSPNTSYTIRARVAATDNVEAGAEKTTTILTSLTVTISGTPSKGCTLTAAVLPAGLTDLTYQWYRGVNAISGATERTYVLTEADVGSKLHVAVSMTSLINSGVSAETAEISNCAHTNTELRGVVAATCTTGGYSGDKYCKDCGTKLADGHATSALGHSYSGEVTTEATCTKAGVRTYTCTRCGATMSETITALGHDYQTYTENEIPATCTEKGSYDEVVKCSRCGKEKSRKAHTIDALGHIYKKGECIRCGVSDPDYSGGEKDAHKIYVSDATGKLTGADSMAAAFKLMKDKNAVYTVFVTENVTESALTFPTVSAITFSGTGKLTLAKTLTRLAPHSSLTIDCAISNAAGKAIAIAMPAKSALTVTANADVTLGALTGKSTATLLVNADTEVESVTTFGAVTVAKGAALSVNNKMTGVDTLNGAVKFNGYRTTNPVKITNIGTAEFTLTQGVASGKPAITPVTVNNVTDGLTLTVVDINGEPVTLENKTVVAKAGSTDDISEKMTITNTDENGDPLALTMNGKNVVVTSGKAAQNVLVTGSKGFKAYASDLTDAFALMTDKKETYTVEFLNDVTESKLTFPSCAGLTLTGEGTLTLTGTTAKLAANSSLTIDCEVVNDKKKAIAVTVPAKATLTLTENAEINLGTLTGKSSSTLLVPFDLTVESVSTFGFVTVADGATLTVTKKLASIGTLNGSVALTGFKSMNSAKITTVGTASITLPMGKVSGKNALAKVTVSKITDGLTLNIVDAKGKPAEIETGMTVAYAGTKTDISDKITLNAAGTYTLSQSEKEIVATAEGAKALLELDGVEYYKWGDVVKAMTDKKKDYTLRLLGDYDIGAKLTLPTHTKYKSLTIDGNGHTLTFVGTTVTLTNDTTLRNLTLTALNSSGKAVKYTISKKNYNLTEENVNYGLGTVK